MSDFIETNENSVLCRFFSLNNETDHSWEQICKQINETINNLSVDYIWHRENLHVIQAVHEKESNDVPSHLVSSTCFGDNIEDEWFIVYLIIEISKQYENLLIQVQDNDGEFMLIEAADYLPKWMDPESTENRVFITKGTIHVIPPTILDYESTIQLTDAINCLVNNLENTKISTEIHKAIFNRISAYPGLIKENVHKAIVQIPLELAALLKLQPRLISPIVHAFYSYDVIDQKNCKDVKFQEYTTAKVTFTKCLYAMLLHAKPIKTQDGKSMQNNKKNMLGAKLTCGYTVIIKKLTSDMLSSKEFTKFINNLKENGYFKENIVGSKEYKILLEKAQIFFKALVTPIDIDTSRDIKNLMSTDEYKQQVENIKNCDQILSDEDNDDWLNIQPEQLNDMLDSRYGKKIQFTDNLTPDTMTNQIADFLHKTSDFEGIERNEEVDEDNNIEFEVDEFTKSLEKMLNFVVQDQDTELVLNSDESDYDLMEDDFDKNNEIDKEVKESLSSDLLNQDNSESKDSTYKNILKGINEEKGFSGPSSNLLRSIGINKNHVIDSDDDLE